MTTTDRPSVPPRAHRPARPGETSLKEFTLEFGASDIYVKTANRVDLENGHILYEAILTDPGGSRTIYIDRDEIVELVKEAFTAEDRAMRGD